jgi:SAM-dependent methyltransferase
MADADTAWWEYDQLESRIPVDWSPATRGDDPWDQLDYHIDLGAGTVPKARLGIDRFYAPGIGLGIDLDKLMPTKCEMTAPREFQLAAERTWQLFDEHRGPLGMFGHCLPFPDDSIKSIITHHLIEHIGEGFICLMDECHRILEPGGFFRIITPLFPSYTAVADPDHKRYFMKGVFETFCGTESGEHWMQSFSVPYTKSRFKMIKEDCTGEIDPEKRWTWEDAREMRVTLQKWPK